MTSYELLTHLQQLGVKLTLNDGRLKVHAPKGVLTLDLQRDLKEHKSDILYLLALPEPAKPGAEVEELRRKIGEMVREAQRIPADAQESPLWESEAHA